MLKKTLGSRLIVTMSEDKTNGMNKTDPLVGAEAPQGSLSGDASDMEEAVDDVEFPEAVVLVGKTHWRCVTCMTYHRLSSSIDQHIRAHHREQTPIPARGRGRALSRSVGRPPKGRASRLSAAPSVRSSMTENSGEPQAMSVTGRSLRNAGSDLPEKNPSGPTAPTTRPSGELIGDKWVRTKRGRWPVRGGRNSRGRGAKGGRGKGGRGRGRGVLSEKLADSDAETEFTPADKPQSATVGNRKRFRERDSGEAQLEAADEEPVSKEPKLMESVSEEQFSITSAGPEEPVQVSVGNTEENVQNTDYAEEEEGPNCSADIQNKYPEELLNSPSLEAQADEITAAATYKAKYLVVVEKAGALSHFPELEAGIIEVDPTIPIEAPSLHADALLPPTTPVLPEIHGPETPVPPETLQHQDVFRPHEVPASLEAAATESANEIGRFSGSRLQSGPIDRQLPEASPYPGNATSVSRTTTLHFSCKICHSVFESQADVKTHLSEVSRLDIVACRECSEKFHGLPQLNMHIFSCHEKHAQKFCLLCGLELKDTFELEEHLLEHTLTGSEAEREKDHDDSHTCTVCGVEIEGNTSDLVNHYHTVHDQFICTICKECFTNITAFQEHKLVHVSDEENCETMVLACPVSGCFQVCENKEALRDHISWHEDQYTGEEVPLLPCTVCNSRFRSKVSLHRHLVGSHNIRNIKPFICELCNEEFGQSLELYQHSLHNHAGIMRYSCPYCPQYFVFRSSFRGHVASQHDVAATILRL